MSMLRNSVTLSRAGLSRMLDPNRDIDKECGYPDVIEVGQYRKIYDREGLGKRVVDIYPEACWSSDPVITDGININEVDSAFSEEWKTFAKKHKLWHYLHRADELSGVGHFGIMVLGIADSEPLNKPVVGVNEKTGETASGEPLDHELQYIKVFSEENIQIAAKDTDLQSARYGMPLLYTIQVSDVENRSTSVGTSLPNIQVHWTRVVHLADNRKDSDVYGVPRMQSVYNRIYDLRKILSGSGEMFWKGGFPGLSFETLPEVQDAEIDKESLEKEVKAYYEGLQRYIALQGMTTKSLTPQIADPSPHVEAMLKIIAIALGIPYRIFAGAEEARLASSQDARAWNKRVLTRRDKYVEPMVIHPFIELCERYGFIKAKAKEGVTNVFWPKMDVSTEEDKANLADKRSNAMAKYVSSDCESIMALKDFFMYVLEYDNATATLLAKHALENDEPYTLKDEDDDVVAVKAPGSSSKVKGGAAPQQGSSQSDEDTRTKTSAE